MLATVYWLLSTDSSFRIHPFRSAVVADGFDGAGEEGFFAERRLLVGLRLFEDEGVARSVGAREVGGRGVAAHVAVNAVRVHVESAGRVFGDAVVRVSHKESDE